MNPDKIKSLSWLIIAVSIALIMIFIILITVFPTIFPSHDATIDYQTCINIWSEKLLQLPKEVNEANALESYGIVRNGMIDFTDCINKIFVNKNIFTR